MQSILLQVSCSWAGDSEYLIRCLQLYLAILCVWWHGHDPCDGDHHDIYLPAIEHFDGAFFREWMASMYHIDIAYIDDMAVVHDCCPSAEGPKSCVWLRSLSRVFWCAGNDVMHVHAPAELFVLVAIASNVEMKLSRTAPQLIFL
jgi:hypothetical protein